VESKEHKVAILSVHLKAMYQAIRRSDSELIGLSNSLLSGRVSDVCYISGHLGFSSLRIPQALRTVSVAFESRYGALYLTHFKTAKFVAKYPRD